MTIAGAVIASIGAVFALLAATGLIRLEDVFARLHAATKASSLGMALVLVGAVFALPAADVALKALIAIVFQFATAPISAHVIGRAAYRSGVPRHLVVDELEEEVRRQQAREEDEGDADERP